MVSNRVITVKGAGGAGAAGDASSAPEHAGRADRAARCCPWRLPSGRPGCAPSWPSAPARSAASRCAGCQPRSTSCAARSRPAARRGGGPGGSASAPASDSTNCGQSLRGRLARGSWRLRGAPCAAATAACSPARADRKAASVSRRQREAMASRRQAQASHQHLSGQRQTSRISRRAPNCARLSCFGYVTVWAREVAFYDMSVCAAGRPSGRTWRAGAGTRAGADDKRETRLLPGDVCRDPNVDPE